jgi:hypothetical protein
VTGRLERERSPANSQSNARMTLRGWRKHRHGERDEVEPEKHHLRARLRVGGGRTHAPLLQQALLGRRGRLPRRASLG